MAATGRQLKRYIAGTCYEAIAHVVCWSKPVSRYTSNDPRNLRSYWRTRACHGMKRRPLPRDGARIANKPIVALRYYYGIGIFRLSPRFRRWTATLATSAVLLHLAVAAIHHHAEDAFGQHFGAREVLAPSFLNASGQGQLPPAGEAACSICVALHLGALFLLPAVILLRMEPPPSRGTGDGDPGGSAALPALVESPSP